VEKNEHRKGAWWQMLLNIPAFHVVLIVIAKALQL
jgi:hypothetical protein